jgi:hypothetical protein
MGLDMYLTKKTYVKNWEYMKPEQLHEITIKGPASATIKPDRIAYVEEEVAYWRKANQIHNWFVQTCQNGVDECQLTYVTRDQLQALLNICKKINEDKSLAQELLPTQEGFFFGSYEYDNYYFEDIQNTIDMLEPELKQKDDGNYYYQSSW